MYRTGQNATKRSPRLSELFFPFRSPIGAAAAAVVRIERRAFIDTSVARRIRFRVFIYLSAAFPASATSSGYVRLLNPKIGIPRRLDLIEKRTARTGATRG